jgi:5-methylcytosine-specific restriction endonuclease McrA
MGAFFIAIKRKHHEEDITMPYRNPRPCMHLGCRNLVPKGRYCSLHRYDYTSYRNSKEWLALRAQVLQEEPMCRICGKEPSTEAEHIVPLGPAGGTNDRSNLQGSCKKCHSRKTLSEVRR